MSYMTMDLSKLQENYRTLSTEFERRGVSRAIVTKLLCGNREYLKAVLSLGALPNIEIIGIGTNLSCLFGVLPNREKLLRLVSARDRLAEEFGVRIPFVSGGTSDMCVLDLGNNPGDLKVGDYIAFSLDYMGALRALSSKYVEKRIVNAEQ